MVGCVRSVEVQDELTANVKERGFPLDKEAGNAGARSDAPPER